jgi:hypothetical protein
MFTTMSYMDAISTGFPTVQCHATGDNTIYDNIIWDAGDPLPSKTDLDTWIMNYVRSALVSSVLDERDRRKLTGGYKVGTYWYHSDTTSRIQQLGLLIMGAGIPSGIMWKTMSGDFVLMTQTLAGQIFQAAVTSDMTLFAIAEQKKAALLASADPASYDYMTGWPKCYGE